jgi:hypothetical protein
LELDNGKEKVFNISKLKRYVRSKFSSPLNPEAKQFTPTWTPLLPPTDHTTSSEETETQPGMIEVEFQPVNSRPEVADRQDQETPNPESVTDNQPRMLDATADEWDIIEHENTQEPVIEQQEESRVTHPPDSDPAEPQGDDNRYPQRTRTMRNPLQLLWGGKSYD